MYLTNGTARILTIGKQTIQLKHVSPSHFAFKNKTLSALRQAMKWIGQNNLTESQLQRIEQIIMSVDDKALQHDLMLFPIWARTIIKKRIKHDIAPPKMGRYIAR